MHKFQKGNWRARTATLGLVVTILGLGHHLHAAPRHAQKKSHKHTAKVTSEAPAESSNDEVVSGVVSKITIVGNKKIEADAIRARLKTKVGDSFDPKNIRSDIQSIFDLDYFYDVQVYRERGPGGIELTYKVVEKPSITEIVYRGQDHIDKDDLQEASGVKPYTILDQNKLHEAVDKITKLYEDKGYFLARVGYHVEAVKAGQEVRVVFDIKENDKVKVKRILFLGNHALSDSRLKAAMQTQEGGFFSFITSSGGYKQEVFDRDISVLNYLYFNEGYVQVKIDRPQVYVTPDKKSIDITIRIEEGEQFGVGRVDFAGDLLFSKEELFDATKIQKNKVFSYEVLQKDLKALQFKYGDLGYAFANIIPRTTIREKEKLVDITFEVEKGPKVYFGRIDITGNTKTRDKVIRRELRIKEGELYNETRKRKSEENVKRLGYFSDVIFNSATSPDKPDILNLNIQVKERSTGTLQVGAGYSTFGGFLFQGQISQTNLFGKGQSLAFSLNVNQLAQMYNLSFTEPYFNDTTYSLGFDVYRTVRFLIPYQDRRWGGDVRIGKALNDYWSTYFTYKIENTEVALSPTTDPSIFDVNTVSGITSSVASSIVYDRRNDRWAPTEGAYGSASIEQAGVGGMKVYTKGLFNYRFYQPLFGGITFRNNFNYGFITVPEDRIAPFNELFLLGGANSLRGFQWFTVGKHVAVNCCQLDVNGNPIPLSQPRLDPYGGTQEFYYQGEFEFPIVTEAGIKGVLFYDTGEAEDDITFNSLRQDVGFGFRWFSPIGPLRFEWGFPLDRQTILGENFSNFEFSLGSPF